MDEEKNHKEGYMDHGNYIGDKGPLFGTRHAQILLTAFGVVIGVALRTSLAMQIVAMTNTKSSSLNPDIPTYNWNNTGVILSSFYWSYVIGNLFVAPLEKKYGVKWILFGGILLNALSYIMIPFSAAYAGSNGVILCRLIQGAGQCVLFPTQQLVLGLWVPAEERTRASVVGTSALIMGFVLASVLSGYLASTWWGWPASFYLFGALSILWCIVYSFLGQNSPATHPRITPQEKRYIQLSLNQRRDVKVSIPWKSILASIHVWAIIIGQIGFAWCITMSVTEFPTYLAKVMKFDIASNGLYSALPPAMGLIAGLIFGPLADYIIKHQYLSTINTRRMFQSTGGFCLAAAFIYIAFLNETQNVMSVVIMVLMSISKGAVFCGLGVSSLDLSPRFAGVIFGLVNASSETIGLFAPILANFVITDLSNVSQWSTVFIATGFIMAVTSTFFIIFASGDRQPWDGPEEEKFEDQFRKSSINGSVNIS